MTILLVDDSRTMRSIQKKILSAIPGAEFLEAGDGLEALSILSALPKGCDLALIDWNMPHMDGITLVKRLRDRGCKMPLIMATTEAEKPRVLEALKAGVNNYVVKPFTPESLMEKVTQTLAKMAA